MIVLGQQLIYATYKGATSLRVNCLESTYFFFRSVWFPQILCFSYEKRRQNVTKTSHFFEKFQNAPNERGGEAGTLEGWKD